MNLLTQVPKQRQSEARELLTKIPYQKSERQRARRTGCFSTGVLATAMSGPPS